MLPCSPPISTIGTHWCYLTNTYPLDCDSGTPSYPCISLLAASFLHSPQDLNVSYECTPLFECYKSVVFISTSYHSPHRNEHQYQSYHYTDIIPVLVKAPARGEANTMFAWDNGWSEVPVGSVIFGSRRFSISLEINMAEILWSLIQVFFKKGLDKN